MPSTLQDQRIPLGNGTIAQVVSMVAPPNNSSNNPPIVFLHGSLHGPWCWTEHFFVYFTSRGFSVVALALRGTSGTPTRTLQTKTSIQDHVDDLKCFFQILKSTPNQILPHTAALKPIVVCHSFAGILFMKYLESLTTTLISDHFAAIILQSSVAPSGHSQVIRRKLWRLQFRQLWTIIQGIPLKKATTDPQICRDLFIKQVADDDLQRFQQCMQQDCHVSVDMMDLSRQLPCRLVDNKGQAPFVSSLPPVLVVGVANDILIDKQVLEETAAYFGQAPVVLVNDVGHDSMLDHHWQNMAKILDTWIQETLATTQLSKKQQQQQEQPQDKAYLPAHLDSSESNNIEM